MAAPEFVPVDHLAPKHYTSPPQRAGGWRANRPGELDAEQPDGPTMGRQGPDQGFALRIARAMADQIHLASGEHEDDVLAGAVAVGLKRASLYSRAPVRHDIEIALRLWGYLDADPAAALIAVRRELFAGVSHHHHYLELRRIADAVPDASLLTTPAQAAERYRTGWEAQLQLDDTAAH